MATARIHYPLDIPESRRPSREHERGEVFPLPYNYWSERRWHEAFARHGLTPSIWLNKLGLYAAPATWFFDRSLHFIARLDKV